MCATKLHSVCMHLLRVICQFHQFSSILRGVSTSYTLCKIAFLCQFGLNSGGFKRPGALRAYVPSIDFAEFCRKRFLRKLYISVSLLSFFSNLKIWKYRVWVLFIYLFNYLFIYLFCLFAMRTFGRCHLLAHQNFRPTVANGLFIFVFNR